MRNPVYNEERRCLYCGKPFWVSRSHLRHRANSGRYCSVRCRARAHESKIAFTCLICGKESYRVPADAKRGRGKYCSPGCAYKGLSILKRKHAASIACKFCGKTIILNRSAIKYHKRAFCSRSCMRQYHLKRDLRYCAYCGGEFVVDPSSAKRSGGIYCSRECMFKGNRHSSLELLLYGALKAAGVGFIPQHGIPESRTIADAFLPDHKAAIYVDGKYWHSLSGVAERDKAKSDSLSSLGYRVFRYSEDEVRSDIAECVNKTLECLGSDRRVAADKVEPLKRGVALEMIKRAHEARRSRSKVEHVCINCGKVSLLLPKEARRKYCGMECRKEYHRKKEKRLRR